jgi:urease accessory protein
MDPQVKLRTTAAAALLAFPVLAWAHQFMGGAVPRSFMEGLISGLGHPVIGLDHLAFVFAAGFLLALIPRGHWGIVALIGGALAGAALHLAGVDLPGAEVGVALSVIVMGGLVIARRGIVFDWVICGVAIAGVLHGHAYAETIFGAEPGPLAAYLIGFSLIQAAIASAAFLLHRHFSSAASLAPVLGAAVGLIGLVFLIAL